MKKTLLILSLVVSSNLVAANIEIYGVGHMSADGINNGTDSVFKIASNSSRLGFKANHDISKTVNVFAQYESGVDLTGQGYDDGNGVKAVQSATFFTTVRESYVGIKTNFGTLKAGVLPVVDTWIYDYNLFADQVGDLGNTWGRSSTFVNRAGDSVSYWIPEFLEGLDASFTYLSDQSERYGQPQADGKEILGYVAKGNYKINGLKFGLGYTNIKSDYTLGDSSDAVFTTSYSKDSFSVGAGYLNSKHQVEVSQTTTHHAYMLGGSYTMHEYTLKSQFSTIDDDTIDSDTKMLALGLDYKLSPETKLYVAYAKTSNGDNQSYLANNYGHGKSAYGAPAAGQDPSAFSLGLVYTFGGSIYKD
ncbi:porin [Sulfurimonas sp. MAG313]|nr:porin [Sulfurimonas sp. MAG313]MDF1881556.1 porin [Sulfurimonas sp. MAG313]